jgi:hypothetical protein
MLLFLACDTVTQTYLSSEEITTCCIEKEIESIFISKDTLRGARSGFCQSFMFFHDSHGDMRYAVLYLHATICLTPSEAERTACSALERSIPLPL